MDNERRGTVSQREGPLESIRVVLQCLVFKFLIDNLDQEYLVAVILRFSSIHLNGSIVHFPHYVVL